MPASTQSSVKGARSWRFRLDLGAAAVAVLAAALIGAFGTSSPATAHPSDPQPCTCHSDTQTEKSKLNLTVSKSTVKPGDKVKVTGKVSTGMAGLKATIQKAAGSSAWAAWKTLKLSAAKTVTATWTAPSAKGTARFRLSYLGDNTHKGGVSAAKKVTVK
jgi:hypothetical protein